MIDFQAPYIQTTYTIQFNCGMLTIKDSEYCDNISNDCKIELNVLNYLCPNTSDNLVMTVTASNALGTGPDHKSNISSK